MKEGLIKAAAKSNNIIAKDGYRRRGRRREKWGREGRGERGREIWQDVGLCISMKKRYAHSKFSINKLDDRFNALFSLKTP